MKNGKRYRRKNNNINKKLLITVLSLVAFISIVITVLVVVNCYNRSDSENQLTTNVVVTKESKTIRTEETNDEKKEQSTTQHTIEPTTRLIDETLPNELVEISESSGYDISQFDFNQLITVDSNGVFAKISFYEKTKYGWKFAKNLTTVNGFVGSQGVSSEASEYASFTPKGLYSIGTGFGICDNPGTKLDYFKVTYDSYWVDDVNSKFYNQHVEGKNSADWDSAEHLIDCKPEYNYAAFIEYNVNPVVAGKGSAFFLHVGYEPTAGCIAIDESTMITAMRWLNKEEMPHILIQ